MIFSVLSNYYIEKEENKLIINHTERKMKLNLNDRKERES